MAIRGRQTAPVQRFMALLAVVGNKIQTVPIDSIPSVSHYPTSTINSSRHAHTMAWTYFKFDGP